MENDPLREGTWDTWEDFNAACDEAVYDYLDALDDTDWYDGDSQPFDSFREDYTL